MNRRKLLQALGLQSLALPFFEALAPRKAWAQNPAIKRVLLVIHRHGTIPIRWAIPESNTYLLSELLNPLASFQNNISQILGIHNPIPYLSSSPHIHGLAEASLLTAHLPREQLVYGKFLSQGPSIDHLIGRHLSLGCPHQAIHLSIGSDEGSPITNTHFLFDEQGYPVSSFADPAQAFSLLFGSSSIQPSHLDGIHEQSSLLSQYLSQEDILRLEHHKERLFELEQSLHSAQCAPESPFAQEYLYNDDGIAQAHIELLTKSFACDQTRMGTLIFDHLEETPMSWAGNGQAPIYDRNEYRTWEDFIHYGNTNDDPDLFQGYLWYSKKVQQLLDALNNEVDIDGQNLLDGTLVIWLSNFENGAQHSLENLPVVLTGAAQSAQGQLLDYRSTPYSLADLWLSVLQSIGHEQLEFGLRHPNIRMEMIPNLV